MTLSFLNPLFEAVAWVMMQIHAGLAVPFGASSGVTWGLSIVILVVLMRLIMVPLFIKQRNSMQKMQSHMPQLQELRKRYKNDKQRLNEETMKFYKENGINPLGGCLPLVAQLPVFWALFNVLRAIAQWTPPAAGHVAPQPQYGMTIPFVQSAHSAHIFGISLYDEFLRPAVGESATSRWLIVVFVLISAATTFLTMRQSQKRGMMNTTTPDPDQPGAAAAASMSKNMMYIAPFFALTGLYWQFGLVIYWVTTNIWTLGQQHFLFRRLPVVGSATVDASAQPASGSSRAAVKSAPARTGTSAAKRAAASAPAKAGAPAKPGAKPATAKPATAKPAGKPGASGAAAAKEPGAGAKTAGKPGASAAAPAKTSGAKAPSERANANGAAADGAPSGGSSMLRRLGRSKEEPQNVPAAPQAKTVRQQPSRQSRSKRGNSGKR